MAKVKDVAFLMECPGCRGSGELRLGTLLEMRCIKCNGYGIFIQKTTKQEMLDYLNGAEQD